MMDSKKSATIKYNKNQTTSPPSTSRKVKKFILLLPTAVTAYIRLFYNLVIVCLFINVALTFSRILQKDIQMYINQKTNDIFSVIHKCEKDYLLNKCNELPIVPALENICHDLDKCKYQDTSMLKTQASIEILGEILNEFFNKLSDRTLLCLVGFTFVLFIASRFVRS